MQRRRANARLYAAFSVMVSARALMSLSPMAVLSAHDGTSPHRTIVSTRFVGPSTPLRGGRSRTIGTIARGVTL